MNKACLYPIFFMLNLIASKLASLPKYIWIFFGISSITTPLGFCYLLINSGNLIYKTSDVEIKFEGRDKANKLSNNAEYSNNALRLKLDNLERDIINLRNSDPDKSKKIEDSFNALLPTAEEAIENSEELSEFVEEAIAE